MHTGTHHTKHTFHHPHKANSHAALQNVRRKVRNLYLLSLIKRNRYKTLTAAICVTALCGMVIWMLKNK